MSTQNLCKMHSEKISQNEYKLIYHEVKSMLVKIYGRNGRVFKPESFKK